MCQHPGCEFSGSRKVLAAHFHATHGQYSGSGYKDVEVEGRKFRVLLGCNEEEIEQWRAERRKKFPTVANIAKKEIMRDELIKAGGVAHEMGKGIEVKRVKREQDSGGKHESINESEETCEIVGGDDALQQQRMGGHLSNNSESRRRPCRYYAQGRCTRGDECTHSHDFEVKVCKFYVQYGRCNRSKAGGCSFFHDRSAYLEYKKNNPIGQKQQQIVYGSISGLKKVVGAKEPSLMSKLLQDQINDEENKILQSFRFLVHHYSLDDSSSRNSEDNHIDDTDAAVDDDNDNVVNEDDQVKIVTEI